MSDELTDRAADEPAQPRLPAGADLGRAIWWDRPATDGEAALMGTLLDEPAPTPTPARRRLARATAVAVVGAAAAAVLLAIGYRWGDERSPPRGDEFTLAATELQPSAAATGHVDVTANGTWIRLDVHELAPAPVGEYYEAWLARGAARVSAGTFHMRGEPAPVVLWAGVAPADYPEFLVTVQSEGDSAATPRVVLRATLTP